MSEPVEPSAARAFTDQPRSDAHRGRLFEPLGWAVIRAPLLPVGTRLEEAAAAEAEDRSLIPRNPRVRAALTTGSGHLLKALARTAPDDDDAPAVRGKLLRYLIRMSARPTPYGMFAGVGLIRWSSETSLALADEPPRTRTRPDMEWLIELALALEQVPEIRSHLRLVANSSVFIRAGRVPHGRASARWR